MAATGMRSECAGDWSGESLALPVRNPHVLCVQNESGSKTLEAEIEELNERSFGWALSCCRWDAEEAADVLQQSYLKILDGRAQFAERSRFSTFLFGVIRRTASERRRQRTTRRLLLLQHARDVEPIEPVPADPLTAESTRLREALAALPKRQREVLHLVFYQDLSVREAAEVMGVGIGSARVHYARGKKRLRSGLADLGDEIPREDVGHDASHVANPIAGEVENEFDEDSKR